MRPVGGGGSGCRQARVLVPWSVFVNVRRAGDGKIDEHHRSASYAPPRRSRGSTPRCAEVGPIAPGGLLHAERAEPHDAAPERALDRRLELGAEPAIEGRVSDLARSPSPAAAAARVPTPVNRRDRDGRSRASLPGRRPALAVGRTDLGVAPGLVARGGPHPSRARARYLARSPWPNVRALACRSPPSLQAGFACRHVRRAVAGGRGDGLRGAG
jgi:hypothetical protein